MSKPMKWRELSEWRRSSYFRGPVDVYYTAKRNGVKYEVSSAWDNERGGLFSWWSHDGNGNNRRHATVEAAKAWCEAHAEGEK